MPRRRLLPLLALLCPLVAPAAPVPKETPEAMVKRVYGEVVEKDAKVACEGFGKDGLRVTVPADVLAAKTWAEVRPALARRVDGDFCVSVRVTHTLGPAGKAAGTEGSDSVTAGLVIRSAGAAPEYECVWAATRGEKGWKGDMQAAWRMDRSSSSRTGPGVAAEAAAIWLRVTRRGDEVTSESSRDGLAWKEFMTATLDGLGSEVEVGPVARHTVGRESVAEFDRYELTPLPTAGDGKR